MFNFSTQEYCLLPTLPLTPGASECIPTPIPQRTEAEMCKTIRTADLQQDAHTPDRTVDGHFIEEDSGETQAEYHAALHDERDRLLFTPPPRRKRRPARDET